MVIYGGYMGGLDGIDIWGNNIWVHDVEVSNKVCNFPDYYVFICHRTKLTRSYLSRMSVLPSRVQLITFSSKMSTVTSQVVVPSVL